MSYASAPRRPRKPLGLIVPAVALFLMVVIVGGMIAVTFSDFSPQLTVAENDAPTTLPAH